MPEIYIIACNGAGKTTAAYNLLPGVFNTVEFINADEIARGLSPFNPAGVAIQAGKIMLERMEQMLDKSQSFAFETTLSGLIYLSLITKAVSNGYSITLFFVYLNSVELANERVSIRVSKGGHTIPKDVIERRYYKGLQNFPRYAAQSHDWYIYNNSGAGYELIASNVNNVQEVINFELLKIIAGDK